MNTKLESPGLGVTHGDELLTFNCWCRWRDSNPSGILENPLFIGVSESPRCILMQGKTVLSVGNRGKDEKWVNGAGLIPAIVPHLHTPSHSTASTITFPPSTCTARKTCRTSPRQEPGGSASWTTETTLHGALWRILIRGWCDRTPDKEKPHHGVEP